MQTSASENRAGYVNATDQSQMPPDRRLYEGDNIAVGDGDFTIGVDAGTHNSIEADYSGL